MRIVGLPVWFAFLLAIGIKAGIALLIACYAGKKELPKWVFFWAAFLLSPLTTLVIAFAIPKAEKSLTGPKGTKDTKAAGRFSPGMIALIVVLALAFVLATSQALTTCLSEQSTFPYDASYAQREAVQFGWVQNGDWWYYISGSPGNEDDPDYSESVKGLHDLGSPYTYYFADRQNDLLLPWVEAPDGAMMAGQSYLEFFSADDGIIVVGVIDDIGHVSTHRIL
ncbi:hypothetical protein GMI69_03590 [Eggerthellaceae bacterium zg-887]|uniref:hypothetical protein n=1 Tax=Xiamenia xianingshaonis TaxID=2682776 RepID=UPI00140E603F|nr:hypothetical protein [Xiamenia xianingshaonis]NHM15755.1 hypothetical protein [Xiamenia xianingshaonis]